MVNVNKFLYIVSHWLIGLGFSLIHVKALILKKSFKILRIFQFLLDFSHFSSLRKSVKVFTPQQFGTWTSTEPEGSFLFSILQAHRWGEIFWRWNQVAGIWQPHRISRRSDDKLDKKISHSSWSFYRISVQKLHFPGQHAEHSNCKLFLRRAWWELQYWRPKDFHQLWGSRRADFLLPRDHLVAFGGDSIPSLYVRAVPTQKHNRWLRCDYLLFLCPRKCNEYPSCANDEAQFCNSIHCLAYFLLELVCGSASEFEGSPGASEELCDGKINLIFWGSVNLILIIAT